MPTADQGKILGFAKREAEVLIMSIQVMRPNRVATNGCMASASELVRIGAYKNAATARSQYAFLRARVMALPGLPPVDAGKQPSCRISTAADTITATDCNTNDKDKGGEAEPPKRAAPGLVAGPDEEGGQTNPFFLSEDEMKRARTDAGLPHDATWVEKEIDLLE